MRTLRQRPRVVGETKGGQPVYELKGVRMILGDNASHFNRLTTCSKCGREMSGQQVLSAADLDHPHPAMICRACTAVTTPLRGPVAPRTSPPVPRPRALEVEPAPKGVGVARAKEVRPAVMEPPVVDRFKVVWAEGGDQAGGADADPEPAGSGQPDQGHDVVPTAPVVEPAALADTAQDFDVRLEEVVQALTQRLDARDAELRAAIELRAGELLVAIDRQAARSAAGAEAQAAIERRLTELAARPMPDPVDLAALQAQLMRALEERQPAVDALEQQLRAVGTMAGDAAGMAAQVAGRTEQTSDELRSFRLEICRRLDEMVQSAPQVDTGAIESLAARVGAIESLDARLRASEVRIASNAASAAQRGDAFERTLAETVDGMTERARTQSELRVALEARVEALEATARGGASELTAAADELHRRLDELEHRVSESLRPEARPHPELIGLRHALAELSERLEGLERTTEAAETPVVDAATAEAAGSTENWRREIEAGFRRGLADAAASPAATDRGELTARLDAVAKQAARGLHEVADLAALLAALDAGLGSLRSEIAAIWDNLTRVGGVPAGADDRLGPVPLTGDAPGGRARTPGNGDAPEATGTGDLWERRARRVRLSSVLRSSGQDDGRAPSGEPGPEPARG